MCKGRKHIVCVLLAALFSLASLSGCNMRGAHTGRENALSYDDAVKELEVFVKSIEPDSVAAPLDIYTSEADPVSVLADIDTFPIVVEGTGQIDIEVAAATEMSASAPDDWMNVVAERFNRENHTVGGKTVSVSVRKITSGEVVTYMTDGGYKPDVYAPSNYAWGEMLKAHGFGVVTLADRILGNTAGILMEKETHAAFTAKYGDVSVDKVLEASLAGDLTFAYTNPFTSSTGLNIFTAMLRAFDPGNPLSSAASEKLLEYQRKSPPVAYTTAVLRDQASKGIIKAMVMEEQAYHNTPELRNYVYSPQGIRHDHPVYTFDYVPQERQDAAKLFVDYCLSAKSQQLGNEKGFNLHNDYKEQSPGLDGAGFISAQKLWKQNKDGGRPIVAVFVADISGSMDGLPLNELKDALVSTSKFIGSNHYVGLVTYASSVYINLEIAEFDDIQRAYFSGSVKSLFAGGGTATYDAVLVGLDMLLKKQQELPDAKPMLFVLSDGQQNEGYHLDRITPIVGGLQIPIYSIAYNLDGDSTAGGELQTLSRINEAVLINANSEDLINQLRNLFNVQM
ncbi:MAG: VWA domain-containing protein [Oscillospiraceae bacterium]|nr:VWA domain-containing protein [Oscillospiraceae bacterium]